MDEPNYSEHCPVCGSTNITEWGGYYRPRAWTEVSRCLSCGSTYTSPMVFHPEEVMNAIKERQVSWPFKLVRGIVAFFTFQVIEIGETHRTGLEPKKDGTHR